MPMPGKPILPCLIALGVLSGWLFTANSPPAAARNEDHPRRGPAAHVFPGSPFHAPDLRRSPELGAIGRFKVAGVRGGGSGFIVAPPDGHAPPGFDIVLTAAHLIFDANCQRRDGGGGFEFLPAGRKNAATRRVMIYAYGNACPYQHWDEDWAVVVVKPKLSPTFGAMEITDLHRRLEEAPTKMPIAVVAGGYHPGERAVRIAGPCHLYTPPANSPVDTRSWLNDCSLVVGQSGGPVMVAPRTLFPDRHTHTAIALQTSQVTGEPNTALPAFRPHGNASVALPIRAEIIEAVTAAAKETHRF